MSYGPYNYDNVIKLFCVFVFIMIIVDVDICMYVFILDLYFWMLLKTNFSCILFKLN